MVTESFTQDVLAAHEIIGRYWAIVDGSLDMPVDAFFTDDCFVKIAGMEISGRDTLVDAVRSRSAKAIEQGRSTRHQISNFVVRSHTGNELILDSLIAVFSGYGEKPAPLNPPSSVGDFAYHLTRADTGGWKISRLEGAIIFAGSDSPFATKSAADVHA